MANSNSQQPLNQAMVQQILHCLQAGQIRKCHAMGLNDDLLKAFENDRFVRALSNSSVCWVVPQIQPAVVERLITRSVQQNEQNQMIDRALILGASNTLICQLFGMTNEEIAHRRKVLGVPQRKGRWPILSQQLEHAIWHRWVYLAKENDVSHDNLLAQLDVVIMIAEEYSSIPLEDGSVVSLAQIWRTLQEGIEHGID
ncbi:DUF2857 domain-containing protein [Pseudomonas caricapapayae]|uniref:DUF2857 domain-containing protein n=1 Tax=Pseudomonas caricapapayae TaxID=46678 RepID=UPI000EFE8B0D|nr:DUF2857 domain-containing protein [Pseudomonas caricapapayae]